MKRFSLNVQILVALIAGGACAFLYTFLGVSEKIFFPGLTRIGATFVNLLQLVALPMVIFSLILGVNSTRDSSELSRIGGRTVLLYAVTTFFSAVLGLILGNIVQPGSFFGHTERFQGIDPPDTSSRAERQDSFLPNNLLQLLSDNNNLIWIVFLSVVFGIALLNAPHKKKNFMLMFCKASDDIFTRIMGYVMKLAPLGIFAMVSSQLIDILKDRGEDARNVFGCLALYVGTVVFGLCLLLFVVYPLLVSIFSATGYTKFLQTMYPAQIFAFTTASSTATLPKTMEQVSKLGVSERVRSFVLSLGATMNMNGTALYQSLAMLFLTQLFSHQLTIGQQLHIVCYVTISAVGVAGVPNASFVSNSILLSNLQSMGIMSAAEVRLSLTILCLVDRPLDMLRSAVNVTGDAMAAVCMHSSESKRERLLQAKK